MSLLSFALLLMAASVIITKCIWISGQLSHKEFTGHPLRFLGLSVAYPLIGGGAAGVLFHWHVGQYALITGIAFLMLSDRRSLKK